MAKSLLNRVTDLSANVALVRHILTGMEDRGEISYTIREGNDVTEITRVQTLLFNSVHELNSLEMQLRELGTDVGHVQRLLREVLKP